MGSHAILDIATRKRTVDFPMGCLQFIIHTKEEFTAAVERWGSIPLFESSIPGFLVEENVDPAAWFGSEPDLWEWKGPVIGETGCDFDARHDWLEPFQYKEHYDLLAETSLVPTDILRDNGQCRNGGKRASVESLSGCVPGAMYYYFRKMI